MTRKGKMVQTHKKKEYDSRHQYTQVLTKFLIT